MDLITPVTNNNISEKNYGSIDMYKPSDQESVYCQIINIINYVNFEPQKTHKQCIMCKEMLEKLKKDDSHEEINVEGTYKNEEESTDTIQSSNSDAALIESFVNLSIEHSVEPYIEPSVEQSSNSDAALIESFVKLSIEPSVDQSSNSDAIQSSNSDNMCPICLNSDSGNLVYSICTDSTRNISRKHFSCYSCIVEWIKTNKDSCPTCRSTIKTLYYSHPKYISHTIHLSKCDGKTKLTSSTEFDFEQIEKDFFSK
jgi:uncharacterized protein with PIN domain